MKRFLIFLLLASCQTAPEKIVTKEVLVPVAIHPVKPTEIPAPPAALGPRPKELSAAADKAFSAWCAAASYIIKTFPLLRVSAGLPVAQAPAYPECEGH